MINVYEIINKYKDCYFYGCKENCPKGLRQTNSFVEKKVLEIKDKKEWHNKDVIRILAWKTGKIKQKESGCERIVYAINWDEEKSIVQLPKQEVSDISKFCERVIEIRSKYKIDQDIDICWKGLLDLARSDCGKGIGTTYLLTILFFITKGEYPIYDRFVAKSLDCIYEREIKKYYEMPDKMTKKAETLLRSNSKYMNYIDDLNEKFDDQWKNNRDIDRALWVYGHKLCNK